MGNSGLDTTTTETKNTLLLTNADDLLGYSRSEEIQMDKVMKEIANSGVKVIVTGSSIGEITHHFLEKYGLMIIQILSKFELQRFCQATGCCALSKLMCPTVKELGFAKAIRVKEIRNSKCIVVEQGPKTVNFATIVLRGSIQSVIDDMACALDSGITAYRTLSTDPRTVPAG